MDVCYSFNVLPPALPSTDAVHTPENLFHLLQRSWAAIPPVIWMNLHCACRVGFLYGFGGFICDNGTNIGYKLFTLRNKNL